MNLLKLSLMLLTTVSIPYFALGSTNDLKNIELVNQDGKRFAFEDDRSYKVISFIYTTCKAAKMCPFTTSLMNQTHSLWKNSPAKNKVPLQFFLITLDPESDTPKAFQDFAKKHHLNLTDFHLLTGKPENVSDLLSHFSAAGHPGLSDTQKIDHTPTTVLLGPDLKEIQRWESNSWSPQDILNTIEKNKINLKEQDAIKDHSRFWKEKTININNFKINKTMPAMSGPTKQKTLSLEGSAGTKKMWIKSLSVEVLNQKEQEQPLTYLCHAWMTLKDKNLYGTDPLGGLMTISEGMESFDFPEGFGMAITPNAKVDLLAQAMNDNPNYNENINYRFKIKYLEEKQDSNLNMKPLKQIPMSVLGPKVEIKDGAICDSSVTTTGLSAHFLVKPGKTTYENVYAPGFFKNQSKIHFIKLHLHRFGQNVKLIDNTLKKVVWEGKATYNKENQIESTSYFSSKEGITINPTHEYKVVSEYNNPTKDNADGMGVIRLYVHEKQN